MKTLGIGNRETGRGPFSPDKKKIGNRADVTLEVIYQKRLHVVEFLNIEVAAEHLLLEGGIIPFGVVLQTNNRLGSKNTLQELRGLACFLFLLDLLDNHFGLSFHLLQIIINNPSSNNPALNNIVGILVQVTNYLFNYFRATNLTENVHELVPVTDRNCINFTICFNNGEYLYPVCFEWKCVHNDSEILEVLKHILSAYCFEFRGITEGPLRNTGIEFLQ